MTLGIFKIGLKSSRKEKKTTSLLSFPLVHHFGRQEDFWDTFLVQNKNQPSSSPYFGATQSTSLFFKWVTFLHLIFGVSCGLFLEIWFTFEVFSSCDLHLGVFVRLMPFGHFVNSFGDSGRN